MDEVTRLLPRRWPERTLIALDGATAALVSLAVAWSARHEGWLAICCGLAASLLVAGRRRWPLPVLGAIAVLVSVGAVAGLPALGAVPLALALYVVALQAPPVPWLPTPLVAGITGVGLAAGLAVAPPPLVQGLGRASGSALLVLVLLGGAWSLGRLTRERRAYAERSAAELAARAVAEERLRIARDLHDVVAHSMGVIAVKAGVANHVLQVRPNEAHDALRVIEATSRQALVELRQLLGVLRAERGGAAEADLAPAPGLAALPALIEQVATAGVQVELDQQVAQLPRDVELAVYRLVQEAVTNVVRHAAPARCWVRIASEGRGSAAAVAVEVVDDGPGHRVLPERDGGHGLIGMQERVQLYGGSFAAGPQAERGFRVSARLPYGREQADSSGSPLASGRA